MWIDHVRFTLSLFAILTPFAAIPIFLALTEGETAAERLTTARIATATVFLVLTISAVAGETILHLIGTSLNSFRVGGGIVLLLMALSMLSAKVSAVQHTAEEQIEAEDRDAIGVVPIGLPLVAGPGSISTVIIEMGHSPTWTDKALTLAAIGLVCAGLLITLQLAVPIGNRLGKTGLNIMNRLTGLLLAAIAIELMANGLRALFPILGA